MNSRFEKWLISRKINPTAMRLLVLDFLAQQTTAINLGDLEVGLVHTDRTTLYRTLKTFESRGLIHSINDGSGTTKYALCSENCKGEKHKDNHLHFYCFHCLKTICLPMVLIPPLELPAGFMVSETSLLAKGVCGGCANKIVVRPYHRL